MTPTSVLPPEWAALPGRWSIMLSDESLDSFIQNRTGVLVEQDLGWKRYAGYAVFTREDLVDFIDAGTLGLALWWLLDDVFRPWRKPDPRWIQWTFDPFPRWTRFVNRLKGWRK